MLDPDPEPTDRSGPEPTDVLDSILVEIRGMRLDLAAVNQRINDEQQAREESIRWHSRLLIVMSVVMTVVVLLGVGVAVSFKIGADDRAASDHRNAQTVCGQGNVNRAEVKDAIDKLATNQTAVLAVVSGILNLADVPNPNETPEQKAEVSMFFDTAQSSITGVEQSSMETQQALDASLKPSTC